MLIKKFLIINNILNDTTKNVFDKLLLLNQNFTIIQAKLFKL